MNIREYQPGDEHKIIELFKDSYGKEMTLDFWNWRFRDNPFGHAIVYLAFDGDRLAAHYAVFPMHDMTCQSGTTMTHPDYRGQGLFPTLAERTYEKAKELGRVLVWGFPNQQSHRTFIDKLDWKDICEIPTFKLDFPPRAKIPFFEFEPDDWCEYRFPKDGYIWGDSGIYKEHNDELQVMLGMPDLGLIEEWNKSISMWASLGHPFRSELERAGFYNTAPVTYYGYRQLDNNCNVGYNDIMMGWSDVF